MPVMCRLKSGKYRIVESGGNIAMNAAGTALDGGGHASLEDCERQARAVNANLSAEPEVVKRASDTTIVDVRLSAFWDKLPAGVRAEIAKVLPDFKTALVERVTDKCDGSCASGPCACAAGSPRCGKVLDIQPTKRQASFYITTRQIDHDREIVIPDGVDMSIYRMNPVLLWAHNYGALPVGKCLETTKTGMGIIGNFEFADHPFAQDVWACVNGGFLKTVSIGFKPIDRLFKSRDGQAFSSACNDLQRQWPELTGDVRDKLESIVKSCLLLETSMAPIPCQPGALVQAIETNALAVSDDFRKAIRYEKVKAAVDVQQKALRNSAPQPITPDEKQFVRVLSGPPSQYARPVVTMAALDCMIRRAVMEAIATKRGKLLY